MILGSPFWLWLLAALAVPAAIHFWNKREGDPRLLGTFRFLPKSNVAKAGSIELHEVPLLFIRSAIILLIALLLAGVNIADDSSKVKTVHLVESDENQSSQTFKDADLEIPIPADRVDRNGWWAVIQEFHHRYRPGLVTVRGSLTQDRFSEVRPSLNADIQWFHQAKVAPEPEHAWQHQNGSMFVYHEVSNDMNVEATITPAQDYWVDESGINELFTESIKTSEPNKITVNQSLLSSIKKGFDFTAGYWNISYLQTELPDSIAALFSTENDTIYFVQTSGGQTDEYLLPNDISGIGLNLYGTETISHYGEVLLKSEETNNPLLYFKQGKNLFLNGEVDRNIQTWFYSGLAHQMIKKGLCIDQKRYPVMTESQRQFNSFDEASVPSYPKKSISNWLFLLLILLWTAERYVSPTRSM